MLDILFISIVLPIIIFTLLLLFEGFVSGWSVDLHQWEDLPQDGQLLDNR